MVTASTRILVIVSLLLIPLAFHSVNVNLDEEDVFKEVPKKNVVVEGMVNCQSCKKLGTSSLPEVEPIPFSRVSITFYYKEYTTDEYGYFYAKLEEFSMDHLLLDHPLTSCKVKLVSSPVESCDIPTNINDGITRASLRHKRKRLITKARDTVFYAARPLAFRPADCNVNGTHY